jgi:hypothetical protein
VFEPFSGDTPVRALPQGTGQNIGLSGEPTEEPAALRHKDDASADTILGTLTGDVGAAYEDPTGGGLNQARDQTQGRRLSGSVPPQERDTLTGVELQ